MRFEEKARNSLTGVYSLLFIPYIPYIRVTKKPSFFWLHQGIPLSSSLIPR